MSRGMPSSEGNPLIMHPALSFSLLVVWIAASVVISGVMCASCLDKPKTPSDPSQSKAGKTKEQEEEVEEEDNGPPVAEEAIIELEAAIHGPIMPEAKISAGSTSKKSLSVSLSMGLKKTMSRIGTKKENNVMGIGGIGEESLWTKHIILGGKCKMQHWEDGEERNDAVLENEEDVESPRSESAKAQSSSDAKAADP